MCVPSMFIGICVCIFVSDKLRVAPLTVQTCAGLHFPAESTAHSRLPSPLRSPNTPPVQFPLTSSSPLSDLLRPPSHLPSTPHQQPAQCTLSPSHVHADGSLFVIKFILPASHLRSLCQVAHSIPSTAAAGYEQ